MLKTSDGGLYEISSAVHVYEHDLLRHQYYLVGWIANLMYSFKGNVNVNVTLFRLDSQMEILPEVT